MVRRYQDLEREALTVLQQNDRHTHTVPSGKMYPHAWLWDSALTSIGLLHVDPKRAATELDTIFEGQWQNGMIPNMRLTPGGLDRHLWSSRRLHAHSPRHIHTSGITQPPIMAEAVQRVSQKLDRDDRQAFNDHALGRLSAYHQWIYAERNPNDNGLFTAVHPWETGMENTPSWIQHMESLDWGASGVIMSGVNKVMQLVRRDTKHTPADQRANSNEGLLFGQALLKLRASRYNHRRLADNYPLHIEDVHINSILIRNNQVLQELAVDSNQPLPDDLLGHMAQTQTSLEEKLWDDNDKLYYPRDAVSKKLIRIPTVASLMPIYAGSSSPERIEALTLHLQNTESFDLPFGVPTVPRNSTNFREKCYWSGPTWVNTNWLLTEGLRRSGNEDLAAKIGQTTLNMVEKGGMREYFSSETAEGLGAKNFSWTAALAIDLARRYG